MRFIYFVGLLTVVLCTACGGSSNSEDGMQQPTVSVEQADLVVYMPTYTTVEQDVFKRFSQRTGREIDVRQHSMAEIMDMAQKGELTGDLVFFNTLEEAVALKELQVLQPFHVNSFTEGEVDDRYVDLQGYYAGLHRWAMISVYNPRNVAVGEVDSYLGMTQLVQRGLQLGMADPAESGLTALLAGMNQRISTEAGQLWLSVIAQNREGNFVGNEYHQLDRMKNGEIQAALVSSGALLRWGYNGDPEHMEAMRNWRSVFPSTQRTNDTYVNISGIAMLNNAPSRSAAMQLIDMLYEEGVQADFSNAYFEYPVQVFAEINDIVIGLRGSPSKGVNVEDLEVNLPAGRAAVEAVLQ